MSTKNRTRSTRAANTPLPTVHLLPIGTGYMLKHPFVNHHLQKVLARWAYRLCTSGGFRLARLRAGGRWLPACCATAKSSVVRTGFRRTVAIASVSSRHGLIVRYPIRMKEDLLPFENLSSEEVFGLLAADLAKRGCQISERRSRCGGQISSCD